MRGALVILVVVGNALTLRADDPPLKWGMDDEGGAPYVFDKMQKGFEVDLATYLAKELNRKSEPVNGNWDKLPELLQKKDIDIVLNGYEYRSDRRKQASIPYYIYRFTLVVNVDNQEIRTWNDLRKRNPDGSRKKVVVQSGTAAQTFMEREFGADVELSQSENVKATYDLVARKQDMDASVQDNPAATYYVATDEGHRLKQVAESRVSGFYVILTHVADEELREKIDEALRKGIRDGTLEKIYRKYNIWNEDQERLLYWSMQPWPPADDDALNSDQSSTPVNWSDALIQLGKAALTTVELVLLSFPLAITIGLAVALTRLYGLTWMSIIARIYVEVIRGTPLLLQLWVIFYLLPQLIPISLPPWYAGILGLAINYSAYEAENLRAGFQSIPKGQTEAALALGMTPTQTVRYIVLPQAFRVVIPPITNDIIAMFKDSSICSAILISELTRQYNVLSNNHREQILTFAIITATLYLLMSYPLSVLARSLERRFGKSKS
jgi:polar amino acid transport system substrate-binding protein